MPADPHVRHENSIGIVVIGRNESANLAACLQSLSDYRSSTVYADSASTDGSADIARRHGVHVVELDDSTQLTPARGRNEGFRDLFERLPGYEFVQFVDGDGIVEPGWISAGVEFLKSNERAAVVCGHVIEAGSANSLYNWLCGEEWKGPIGRIDACGGNAMFRVAPFKEAGGFRSDLTAGEEAELMARMRAGRWEIWRLDVPMVVHHADIHRFSDWWRRTRRGGFAYANVWSLTKDGLEPLYGAQLRSSLFWVAGLPATVVAVTIATRIPVLLLLYPVASLLQVGRIAARRGLLNLRSWAYAGLIMLAKLPEAMGIAQYVVQTKWRSRV